MKAKPKTDGKTTRSKTKSVTVNDTEAQRTLEALQRSAAKFSILFNNAPYAAQLAKLPDGLIVEVNEAFENLIGYSRAEAVGKSSVELNIYPDPEIRTRMIAEFNAHGFARNVETTLRAKSGDLRTVLVNSDLIEVAGEKYILTTAQDITERKQSEQQIVQMKRLYATLSQVNQTIVRVKSQEELYQSICDVALKFGELTFAWIGLLDEVTGDIRPVAVSGLNVAIDKWPFPSLNIHRKPSLNSVITDAMHTSNTVTSEDVQTDERTTALRDVIQKFGFHSLAAVPFRLRGKTTGVLVMTSVERGVFDAPEELKLLDEMGLDISFALDTMELEAERRQAVKKIERQNQRLKILREIDIAILTADSVRNIVGAALGHIRELLECLRTNLTLIDRDTNELVIFEAMMSGETSIPAGSRLPLAQFEDIIQTLSQNQPILLSDLRTVVDPMPGVQRLLKDGVHSTCSLPLFSQGSLIGMFSMHSEIPSFFDEEKIALGREVANQVAIAITQSRLVASLRASEEKYSVIFDRSPFALTLTKMPEATIVGVNHAFLELFEFTSGEVIGKTSVELGIADPESRAKIGAEFQARGWVHDFEVTRNTKTGRHLDLALNLDWVTISEEKYILTTIRDITERKQAEQQIEYQANLLKHINDAVIAVDDQFHITAWNHAAETMYGWSAEEVLGNLSTNIIRSEMAAEERQEILKQLRERGMYRNEIIQYRKDGQRIHVEASTITLYDKDNKVTGLLSVNRDITERKRAEEQLRYQAYLLKNVNDAIIASDAQFRLKAWNPAAEEMYGWKAEEVLGRNGVEILQTRFSEADAEEMRRQIAESGHYVGEATQLRKDGTRIPVEVASIVLRDDAGKITDYVSVNRDITERKQAEAALQLENERFQRFVESNIVGIIIANASGKVITANDYYLNLLGVTRQDFEAGKLDWRRFTPPEWLPADEKAIQELREHGVCEPYEKEYERADGRRVHVYIADAMLPGPDGQIAAFVLDITERKHTEAKIQQQLERLNSLHAIDTTISSSFDIQVTLDVVLQQVLAQLGVDAAAILLLNPQLQTIEYAASRGFRSNALKQTQLQLNEGYAGRAVHERKTIYIPALLETDGKLAEVMRSAQEDFVDYYGIPLVSKDGIKGVLEIYHRSTLHPDSEWLVFLETLAGQATIAIDNAQLFEHLQHANAELEQRVAQRTEELKRTNIELEHANRTKDEFLATMSHELRTPLNSILGMSETLLEQRRDPLSEFQQRYLQTIASSGSHLLALINDILDLSKIEAGKFDYQPQIIAVDELCRSSLAFVNEQAIRKAITLNYSDPAAVSKMYGDPRRIKQILVNLLTNAVKFTAEKGQVTLQVHGDMEQDRLQFSVIDTGIGIAPEALETLFQPFVQVDSRLTREYEGTGLGLALVQKLTDLQGGSVDVESAVGTGSRFTINLPIGKAMLEQQTGPEADGQLPLREQPERSSTPATGPTDRGLILLAEDNAANILTIGDYLESHGYQVVVARDGVDAILKAQELQPDIILMDIQMPALDGLEAIRRLRADGRFAATPIIALTALAMPGDRERCLEAGANEYLSKPVSLKSLANTIHALMGNSAGN